jgi:outer membrane protein assembly factor BamB
MRTLLRSCRLVLLFVTLVTIIGLAACTAKPTSAPPVTVTATPAPAPTVTTTPPAITVTATPVPTPAPAPTPPPASSPWTPPPEVAQYAKDWPLPGKDYNNTRATMDSSINSSNVKTLGASWVFNVPSGQGTFGSISTTPIILGNNVYVQDIGNNTMLLDLATGQQKWQTVYNIANEGPNGASVGYGKVFVSASPYEMVALDATTGKEVWRTPLVDVAKDPSQGVNGIDIQTIAYDGIVYTSTVPGNAGVFYAGGGMGVIYALDQATGKVLWSFNTIKDTGLWGHPEINSGGGAWYPPSIDTQTGMMFIGVGNPGPFPGQPKATGIPQDWPNGTSRPGPNLYTCTALAFDHKTGELKWYNQVRPHDINDYDLQIPPILATASYAEKQQDVAIFAGKMGYVYMMNRQTGALLWEIPVGQHTNDLLAAFPTNAQIPVIPSAIGGVETPMSYADGVVYVLANNTPSEIKNGLTTPVFGLNKSTSDLLAIDVNYGRILWDVPLNAGGFGGTTVVNDLVFTATYDGMLYAFKRDTGEQVWSYKAPAGVNAFPAFAGDMMVLPVAGPGGPASIIGFKLGSTSPGLKLASPGASAQLPAGDLPITTEVTNFSVVDKQGQANVPGEGHLHFYLDVDAPTAPGQPAIPSSGVWAHVSDTNYTFKNVAAGSHTISVELVNNDHTPLNPPVVQKITVALDTNARITISSPSNGAIKKAGSITINASVSNFNVVDKQGTAAIPGEGHLHFYMDVQPPTDPTKPAIPPSGVWAHVSGTSYTFQNVPVGLHTFYVQLVNNDHTPLSPNLQASIQVYVITYTGGYGAQ